MDALGLCALWTSLLDRFTQHEIVRNKWSKFMYTMTRQNKNGRQQKNAVHSCTEKIGMKTPNENPAEGADETGQTQDTI